MKTVGMIIVNVGELVQAVVFTYFFHRMFGFQEKVKSKKCKVIILSVVLFVIERGCMIRGYSELLFTAIWIIIMLFYSKKYLRNTTMQHLIWSMYALLMLPLISILLLLGTSVILQTSVEAYMKVENPIYLLVIVVARVLYFMILTLTIHFNKENRVKLPKKYGVALIILFGYSLGIEAIIFAGFQLDNGNRYKWGLLGIALGVVLLDAYLFAMIFKISEKYQQEEALKLLWVQNELQQKRIEEAETETKRIRQLRHDYKSLVSNLSVMLQRGEYEKIQEYINEINRYYLKNIPEYINTNNSMIDAAINTKFVYCNENGIGTTCKILGDCKSIDNFQLSIIILNLLDNAIEASKKEAEKTIDLQMKRDEEYIHLIVRNKIQYSVLEKNPGLKTSKKEVGHGLGLEHVKSILDKNKGLLEIYEEKGWFCVHVMFFINDN